MKTALLIFAIASSIVVKCVFSDSILLPFRLLTVVHCPGPQLQQTIPQRLSGMTGLS